MSKPIELNGIDFLLMAQNGSLKVDIDENGNIKGIDLDDSTVERFDGLLVALHDHTRLLMDNTYTVIVKDRKTPETEMIVDEPAVENIENVKLIED